MSNQFQLGQKLQDRVTGLTGIAIAKVEHLNGCVRYSIQPPVTEDKPNDFPEAIWIDVEQLEYVNEGVGDIASQPSGGDRKDPPSRHILD